MTDFALTNFQLLIYFHQNRFCNRIVEELITVFIPNFFPCQNIDIPVVFEIIEPVDFGINVNV